MTRYLISNNHPAIIDRDTFNLVQAELARRNNKRKKLDSAVTEQGKYAGVRYSVKEVMPMSDELYEDSQRERILSLIAVCGELPADQISRLPGGERYKLNMIQQLIQIQIK